MKKTIFILGIFLLMCTQAFAENIHALYPYFKNFNRVQISGSWNVTIKQGPSYSVKITAPQDAIDKLLVENNGDCLTIGLKSHEESWHETLKAEITMPDLTELETSGSSDIAFAGFTSKNLEIHTSGSGDIQGNNNNIENLSLETSGSPDTDLIKSTIANADIRISGSSNVKLTMTGNLNGKISGSGSIIYYGKANLQSMSISGSGKIVHR